MDPTSSTCPQVKGNNACLTPALPNPTFSDIVQLLQTLTDNDPNIESGSPHGAFWKQNYDTFMAQKTDAWTVPGSLVVKGDPNHSNLLLALSGKGPFAELQMPDPKRCKWRIRYQRGVANGLHLDFEWMSQVNCGQRSAARRFGLRGLSAE